MSGAGGAALGPPHDTQTEQEEEEQWQEYEEKRE